MAKNKKIKHRSLKYPYADLVALWTFRILLNLKCWKNMGGLYGSYTSDGDLLRTIGLGHVEDTNISKEEFHHAIKGQYRLYSGKRHKTCAAFEKKFNRFTKLIALSKTEVQILKFILALHNQSGLNSAADLLGELNGSSIQSALSIILNMPEHKIKIALSGNGKLIRSGILKFRTGEMSYLRSKLCLMDGISNMLFNPGSGEMLHHFFQKGKDAHLKPADYNYIADDYSLIKKYLQEGKKQSLKGINILVYGCPGTGKTELTRTMSRDLGLDLFEISTVNTDGDTLNGSRRIDAFQLSQQILAQHDKALILFDEIEDVFPSVSFFFGTSAEEKRKAWINKLLEENPVPAFWVCNDIDELDNAYIRRFDIVLKLDPPPKNVREKMLNKYLAETSVSQGWIKRAAENQHLAPALISRAARVASMTKEKENTEKTLEKVLGNTLCAMGYSGKLMERESKNLLSYRLDALNPDRDINKLLAGMKKHNQARICLYGPPGTGKTAFGRYVAKSMGQKLSIKRASDILASLVGETEKNIARMFAEARSDNAILLLDEADSFLRDRSNARQSWEVSQVNELLTRMEEFDGIFICSTNLVDALDAASLRRFDLKIKFDYLLPDQAWILFRQTLLEYDVHVKEKDESHWKKKLSGLRHLTPGDFATVIRQYRLNDAELSAEALLHELAAEVAFKQQPVSRGIGFTATI